MERTNLTRPGGEWDALRLVVPATARPSLRMLTAKGRRLVLVDGSTSAAESAGRAEPTKASESAETPVLFAEVELGWWGVDYHCTGRHRSPLGPIRAAEARALGTAKAPDWYARWAHRMADALALRGPLYGGAWVLSRDMDRTRLTFPAFVEPELPAHPTGYLDYGSRFAGEWEILPLRPLSPADAGRVKAYRKQVRDETLPPVLLWWVGMLATHVVLDGHDRLAASIAERRVPPLLALSRPTAHDAHAVGPVRGYEQRMAALEHVPESAAGNLVQGAGRQLARDLHGLRAGYGLTRAWLLKGGVPEWQRRVDLYAPDWER
ncbi:hypothetical protein [Embleya sp. NBC_00896]|uniref:hypothetical protein n=1 Tax=Embleya sp. NBC_00896 TaxID=2975961 RepID=UPI00386969CE|nr:hypothetical protein OG928_05120 [Embleya sp. NBC_00896]